MTPVDICLIALAVFASACALIDLAAAQLFRDFLRGYSDDDFRVMTYKADINEIRPRLLSLTGPEIRAYRAYRRTDQHFVGDDAVRRTLPEWIASSPDAAVPPRVRVRVFDRYGGRCQCGCYRLIRPGEAWDCEDTIALINGGERREDNLKPWLAEHHPEKTARDVAEKSRVYRKRARHLGIKKPRSITAWRKFNGDIVRASRER